MQVEGEDRERIEQRLEEKAKELRQEYEEARQKIGEEKESIKDKLEKLEKLEKLRGAEGQTREGRALKRILKLRQHMLLAREEEVLFNYLRKKNESAYKEYTGREFQPPA